MRTLTVRLNSGNQIEVCCGSESRCGECYYLSLSESAGDNGSAEAAPRTALQHGLQGLLREWTKQLQSLDDGGLLWLPFDFSDEYTRWLAVNRSGDEASLVFGWAPVEGWAIDPQNLGQLPRTLESFVPDEPLVVQVCSWKQLLMDVAESELQANPENPAINHQTPGKNHT
jgi:hypothetical protein